MEAGGSTENVVAVHNRILRRWTVYSGLVAVYICSRLPLIYAGYGSDNDSLLYGLAAKRMLESGAYDPSRSPGFPLFEQLCVLCLRFDGWKLINWLTAGISLIAVVLYYHILRFWGYDLKKRMLLCAFFAFFPLFWINSASVMDYNWAICLVLGSYLALLHNRWELSAVCLGLACGFRLTSGIFWVPCAFYMLRSRETRKFVVPWSIMFGVVILLCYAPVFLKHGIQFIRPAVLFHISPVFSLVVFLRYVYKFLGFVPGLFLGLGVVLYWRNLKGYVSPLHPEHGVHALAVGLGLLLQLIFPGQDAYLLPIVPFALCVMVRVFPTRYVVVLFLLFLSYNFVTISVYDRKQRTPEFTVRQGALLEDMADRKYVLSFPQTLASISFPDRSLVFIQGLPLPFGVDDVLFEPGEYDTGMENVPIGRKIGSQADVIYMAGTALLHPRIAQFIDLLRDRGYTVYMQKELYAMCRSAVKYLDYKQLELKNEWNVKVFEVVEGTTW